MHVFILHFHLLSLHGFWTAEHLSASLLSSHSSVQQESWKPLWNVSFSYVEGFFKIFFWLGLGMSVAKLLPTAVQYKSHFLS